MKDYEEINFGETFKRYASVCSSTNGLYYVTVTDWTNRKGGSLGNLSKHEAIKIAERFCNGSPYTYSTYDGIILTA